LTVTLACRPAELRADVEPAVLKAVHYVKGHTTNQQVGETALIALALIKAEVPAGDPTLSACIAKVRARFSGNGYQPERSGGQDIYEAAVVTMALANLNREEHRAELQLMAQFLVGRQNANGSWDYVARQQGDSSISQYALLGLWEAENSGAEVRPEVWDRAAAWYLSVQGPSGSWNYHRDQAEFPETISMTAAGVGSLLICQRQLARYRKSGDTANPLLTALVAEGAPGRYDVSTSASRIDIAVKRGLGWLGANFTVAKNSPIIGQSVYYALYGIERAGALADRESLGKVDWFNKGRAFLLSGQKADGSWSYALQSDEMNTAWAVLFLTRSTAKTLRRIEIRRLGAGTLLGGRGLPKDLSSMTIAGGRVVSRPMNGAVEGMLAVLEDPRAAAENAGSAASGLVSRYQTEGPAALRPHKDRFRKMLTDRDPGLRRVAAWSLARTGDLDVVPALIGALTDPDDDVVNAARQGLQLLSRKIDGLGPPPNATPEQRKEAARKWRQWFEATRPLDLEGQDDDEPAETKARSGGNPR
jgi:hypothetical protein